MTRHTLGPAMVNENGCWLLFIIIVVVVVVVDSSNSSIVFYHGYMAGKEQSIFQYNLHW